MSGVYLLKPWKRCWPVWMPTSLCAINTRITSFSPSAFVLTTISTILRMRCSTSARILKRISNCLTFCRRRSAGWWKSVSPRAKLSSMRFGHCSTQRARNVGIEVRRMSKPNSVGLPSFPRAVANCQPSAYPALRAPSASPPRRNRST